MNKVEHVETITTQQISSPLPTDQINLMDINQLLNYNNINERVG